ncbi:uncharacterized protein PSANT_00553 [Moesziomyces antarcticus]|uniref:Uncharacterized protein n=1 Tax=Pseudozyma antarctica TaxID=84753 RepID=A0A5C3FHK7_PSEA2|nr:uncharacterized protein PSANT_00553 [Moesziomyces antarcticus]
MSTVLAQPTPSRPRHASLPTLSHLRAARSRKPFYAKPGNGVQPHSLSVRQANQKSRDGQAGLLRYLAPVLLRVARVAASSGCETGFCRILACSLAASRRATEIQQRVWMDGHARLTAKSECAGRVDGAKGRRTNQRTASTSEKGLARDGRKGAV